MPHEVPLNLTRYLVKETELVPWEVALKHLRTWEELFRYTGGTFEVYKVALFRYTRGTFVYTGGHFLGIQGALLEQKVPTLGMKQRTTSLQ